MLLENLGLVDFNVYNDGKHVDIRLMDDMGVIYVAYCSFKGKSYKRGRTYRDGLAETPAENSFTCTEILFEYAYDESSDNEIDIEGDFNIFCDDLSYCETE